MFFKTGHLKNCAIFTGKYLCWSLFLIKLCCNPVVLGKHIVLIMQKQPPEVFYNYWIATQVININ